MRSLWASVGLIRIHNCLLAAIAVGVGWYLAPDTGREPLNRLAMMAAFFVCGFGNIINDIRDIEIDRIAHPRRALPSGAVSLERARSLAFAFLVVVFALLIGLNGAERIIIIVGLILVVHYNLKLKHTPYWGNLTVSILAGLTFVMGGASSGFEAALSLPGPLIPAVFAILMHFSREVIKDVQDRSGDLSAGSNTAPVRSGTSASLVTAYAVLALLCGAALGVYFAGWFTRLYLMAVAFLICIPIVIQMLWLGFHPQSGRCRVISAIIKWQMLIGLIALSVGKKY